MGGDQPPTSSMGEIETGKKVFSCLHVDAEMVHKIAEAILLGLATACVDNTTGDLFKTPTSVAANIREEMVSYLYQRSESFVAEYIILDRNPSGNLPVDPYEVISDMVDDFAMSKRNIFSRVSGWLLSESREEKIDDFTQDLDLNRVWISDKREAVGVTILKNVDLNRLFHCGERFTSEEELSQHGDCCVFKPVNCCNEGCAAVFSASLVVEHDSRCPFKVVTCEQECSARIMRRDMDKHCVTVCPMRMVKCPFYSVGCESVVPHCTLVGHFSESLHLHSLMILRFRHKNVSDGELEKLLCQLELISSPSKMSHARDVRTLTSFICDLEAKSESSKVHTL